MTSRWVFIDTEPAGLRAWARYERDNMRARNAYYDMFRPDGTAKSSQQVGRKEAPHYKAPRWRSAWPSTHALDATKN